MPKATKHTAKKTAAKKSAADRPRRSLPLEEPVTMPPTATPCEQAGEAIRVGAYNEGVSQGKWEGRREHEANCLLHQLEMVKADRQRIKQNIEHMQKEEHALFIEYQRLHSLITLALKE
jgi:hypothetical protein